MISQFAGGAVVPLWATGTAELAGAAQE